MFTGKLHAGWLIDGSGRPARKQVMLEIREGRVQAIGPASADPCPEAAIDLTGATLLPGLIDSHVHLCLPESAVSVPPNRRSQDGGAEQYDLITLHLRQSLAHGIAAVRDGGDRRGAVRRYKHARVSGEAPKVAIHTPGSAFYKKGRYGGFIGKAVADGEALPDAVRDHAPRVDHIKILNSGINSLTQLGRETPSQFTPSQLRQAVLAAAEFDRSVMVHANGREPVADAIAAGCRSIEHGYFMGKENLLKMRDEGMVWVPTAIPMKAREDLLPTGSLEADIARRTLDHQLQLIAFAREAGVIVAAGSDAGSPGVAHGAGLVEELKLLQFAGYSIEEAICCASANGALLIASDLSGRIEIGERVAIVVAPGSPDRLPESLARVCQIYVADGSLLAQRP